MKQGTRKGLVVMAVLLVLTALCALCLLWTTRGTGTGKVKIFVNGALYAEGDLSHPQNFVISGENGERNVIEINALGAVMKEASCPDQLCVQQGRVNQENCASRPMGNRIVCLPNRVVVELELDGEAGDVPDA